jgi:hypothetical protein
VYKPSKNHVVVNALLKLPYIAKPIGLPDRTKVASIFYIELE